jgi:diguanylate cyclase (GGDEF)-like protein
MSLRTRIALTFLLLLTAVLAAALGSVSFANRVNAEHAVKRQLESNRHLLTLAARGVADDYAFREAVAQRDTNTLVSALENGGTRIGATMIVLTSLNGQVMAASGSRAAVGAQFPIESLQRDATSPESAPSVMVDNGKIYQLVAVEVKSPLPVAWIIMGFELDQDAANGLEKISGLTVSLLMHSGDSWQNVVTSDPAGALGAPVREIAPHPSEPASLERPEAKHTLERSLADARAPFERLTTALFWIAGVSLIGFGWAAFWIARNITRPLQELTESVHQIRGGTYDVALKLQRSDELGVLAEGLQLMQSALMSRDQSIRQLAYEDTLTGLMNRTAFSDNLRDALTVAAGSSIGVAVINLNRFRRINEHLGYSVGDAVLANVASRLSAVPSVASAVARLAADQFAAFTRLRDPKDLQAWGTSLLLALSEPVVVEAQPIDISATIGLAASLVDAPAADDLLRCADLALEQARREKRPLAMYEKALDPATRDQLSLLGELRHAVEHRELRLFFQPKIELATGRVAGAEVLLRWQHPTRGLLSPAAFVPYAEQTGFIRRITRWTLDRAMAQAAEWHRAGNPLQLAVNISAEDIADVRFDTRVAGLLTRHQLPPSLLTLELTESGFIEDPNQALGMLDALAALGVNLSIDDFGTGYSSLSHLARMPANEVKIDRSFVQGLESDVEYAAVVRSAIDMGHSLGMKVVAEGIETEVAAQLLRAFGCDIAQGFLYARPMPCEALEIWLEGKERTPIIAVPIGFNVDEVTDTVVLAAY